MFEATSPRPNEAKSHAKGRPTKRQSQDETLRKVLISGAQDSIALALQPAAWLEGFPLPMIEDLINQAPSTPSATTSPSTAA